MENEVKVYELKNGKRIDTGRTYIRGSNWNKGEEELYIVGANVWIINNNGDFLMQKRSENKTNNPGKYSSTNGLVEQNERSVDAACREVKEELGIKIDKDKLILVEESHIVGDHLLVDIFVAYLDVDLNDITIQESEVAEVCYKSLDEILASHEISTTCSYIKELAPRLKQRGVIIPRNKLYDNLQEICREKYSIGFHAIDYYKDAKEATKEELLKKAIETEKKIIEDGLEIKGDRPLLGTVAFPGFRWCNESDFVNYHSYGEIEEFIIVAIPKYLVDETGEQIFLGHPVYNMDNPYYKEILSDEEKEFIVERNMGSQGRTITSLADAFIPDYDEETGIGRLNSMFILGSFSIIGNNVMLNINPNHICFNNDLVPTNFFERKKNDISGYLSCYGIEELPNEGLTEDKINKMLTKANEGEIKDANGLCYLPVIGGEENAIINTLEQLQRIVVKRNKNY